METIYVYLDIRARTEKRRFLFFFVFPAFRSTEKPKRACRFLTRLQHSRPSASRPSSWLLGHQTRSQWLAIGACKRTLSTQSPDSYFSSQSTPILRPVVLSVSRECQLPDRAVSIGKIQGKDQESIGFLFSWCLSFSSSQTHAGHGKTAARCLLHSISSTVLTWEKEGKKDRKKKKLFIGRLAFSSWQLLWNVP